MTDISTNQEITGCIVELMITTICPFACEYCYGKDVFGKKGRHVPFETLRKRMNRLLDAELFKNTGLILIGGEPTLHPEFMDIAIYWIRESNKRGYSNSVGAVTAGSVLPQIYQLLKRLFLLPNRWQLSLHEKNNESFQKFLFSYYEGYNRGKNSPLRINIIFENRKQALAMINRFIKTVNKLPFNFFEDQCAVEHLYQAVDIILDPSNTKRSAGFSFPRRFNGDIFVFLAMACGLESRLYRPDRDFRCSMIDTPIPNPIVVDENGLVRLCTTPNHRFSPAMFNTPIEDINHLDKHAWLSEWNRQQRALLISLMDYINSNEIPTSCFSDLLTKEFICEICRKNGKSTFLYNKLSNGKRHLITKNEL